MCIAPSGEPALRYAPPESRLGLEVRLDEARLSNELSERVPKLLAQASGREVGAPGKLSYKISRGSFSFALRAEELVVSTELNGDIEVCKPLGPVCLRYGECRPSWNAQVSLPLAWQVPLKATTHIEMTSGCVLKPVGYNATPHVKEVTAKEAAKVGRRINLELAEAQRQWLAHLGEGLRAVPVATDAQQEPLCLRFTARELAYSVGPSGDPSKPGLRVAGQVRGQLGLGCESAPALPAPEYVSTLEPGVDVHVPVEVSFRSLEQQLRRTAAGAVTLRSFRSFGAPAPNTLYVGLEGYNDCGTLWLLVQPQLTPGGIQLKTTTQGPAAEWLSAQVLAFPPEKKQLEGALAAAQNRLETQLARLRTEHNVHAQFSTEPMHELHVSETALVLLLRLRGQVQAQVH